MHTRNQKLHRNKRGFTLVELMAGVIILAILSGIGYALLRDTASTARNNAIATNVNQLQATVTNLDSTGAVFAAGTAGITQGTNTTVARVTLPATATAAAVDVFINALEAATGIKSMGVTATLAKGITNTTYTYTLDANNKPVWAPVANAIDP